jgi:hypothetical protein
MGGVGAFVRTVLDLLGIHVVPWVWASIVLGLVLVSTPWWWANLRTDQARRMLRLAAREQGEAREALEGAALNRVRGHTWGLIAVAEVAMAQGRTSLAEAALRELRGLRAPLVEMRRLERALHGDLPATAVQARLRVEALRAEGLHVGADELLARARARWPEAAELREPPG